MTPKEIAIFVVFIACTGTAMTYFLGPKSSAVSSATLKQEGEELAAQSAPLAPVFFSKSDPLITRPTALIFQSNNGGEVFRISEDGKVTVRGKPVAEDIELYRLMKRFFAGACAPSR